MLHYSCTDHSVAIYTNLKFLRQLCFSPGRPASCYRAVFEITVLPKGDFFSPVALNFNQ